MKQPVFEGVCTALVTPFRNGTVDMRKLEQLLDLQIASGVSAVVVCGTTGESATLSTEEHLGLIAHAIQYTNRRIRVIAGTGSNDTAHAMEMSRVAASMGADGLLLVTPYYNKTTQAGLVDHYAMIADAVPCPVIVYNVPSRTGVNMTVDTYKALSQHPNINGVKEASGDLPKVQRTLEQCGEELHIWSGNDDQIVPMMAVGGKGVISVLSNLCPKEAVRLLELCKLGGYREAGRLQCGLMPLIDGLFREVNPIPVKAALNLLGYGVGLPRRPLLDMTEEGKAVLRGLLERYKDRIVPVPADSSDFPI